MDLPAYRPPGDQLQEILERGPQAFLQAAGLYPNASPAFRVSVGLGGLSLGEALDEQVHALLASQESPAKKRALLGLGCMGHPVSEGYLARILRERRLDDAAIVALQGLGRIRGRKSLPLIIAALDDPALAPYASAALASYREPAATVALLEHAEDVHVRRVLAEAGVPQAADLFRPLLSEAGPDVPSAVRWVGVAADAVSADRLLPHLVARDPLLARSAFEAYAALGAPSGPEPLLRLAAPSPEPWMVEALGRVDHPDVHRFLMGLLAGDGSRGFLAAIRRRMGRRRVDARLVYRSLRVASEPEVVGFLANQLSQQTDPVVLGEILENRSIVEDGQHAQAVLALWKRGDLLVRHLAARAMVQAPTEEFLVEAVRFLGRPAFVPLDGAPAAADPARMIESYAREQNPPLAVGDFLVSGLLDLEALDRTLCSRLAERAFPPCTRPSERFRRPEDEGTAELLEALAEAHPTMAKSLWSLWVLLAQAEQGGDPLLNLFLSWMGAHRGGLRRSLARNLLGAIGRFISGKTDRDLPKLEAVEAQLPQQGPLARSLREALEQARRALMAECRDMTLMVEGRTGGHMVLIDEL